MEIVGLIVPDVHEEINKMKFILEQYPHVKWVLFLGDFMDSFAGLTWKTFATVDWLVENLPNPKYTFLWGNHDMHYAFPIEGVMCSGFDPNKLEYFKKHLKDDADHLKRFKLMHWIGQADGNSKEPTEWLVSHAGIHPSLLNAILGFDKNSLAAMEEETMWKLRCCQQVTSLIAIGHGRGGHARVGGIDWLDWETEFVPIPGLNQIVGHSYDRKHRARSKNLINSTNYCIDTALRHIIEIYNNGTSKIKSI